MDNLPLVCMNQEVGQKIGSTIGQLIEVDTREDGIGWEKYLRVKIVIGLKQLVARGI